MTSSQEAPHISETYMVSPKIALQNGDKNPGCFRLCAEARFVQVNLVTKKWQNKKKLIAFPNMPDWVIENRPNRGRCVVAQSRFSAGDIVQRNRCVASVLQFDRWV
jgi:hypothetical protein